MKFYKISLFVVFVFYKLEGAKSIKCYQCSSAEDPKGVDNCGAYGNFRKEHNVAVDCSSDESKSPGTFCMKVTQQGPRGFIWDGRWRQVIRQCASVAENGVTGVCNWGVLENGVYWEKCYCSNDNCNSSMKHVISKSLIFLVTSAYFIYCKYLM